MLACSIVLSISLSIYDYIVVLIFLSIYPSIHPSFNVAKRKIHNTYILGRIVIFLLDFPFLFWMKPKYTVIIISISLNSCNFWFFYNWACHSAFNYCLLCNWCHVEVPYLSYCEHTYDALKCCLGRELTRFWNRAWMRQPLNGDSASPQSLSDSNCYHLGPLFCSLSASVSPNHVSI